MANGDISVSSKDFKDFEKKTDDHFNALQQSIDTIKLSMAERRHKDKVVENNERAVDDHEKRISRLEDRVKLILVILGGILMPLLSAIGYGIIRLLQTAGG